MDPVNLAAWLEANFGVEARFGGDDKLDFTTGFKSGNTDFTAADLAAIHAQLGGLTALETGITAGTTQTQAGAYQLTAGFSNIGTVGTANDGVALQEAKAGRTMIVRNSTAKIAKVYPMVGKADTIEGGAADAAVTIPPGATITFRCLDATAWVAARTVRGIGNNLAIVAYEATLDGANPTPVVTGLNVVVGVTKPVLKQTGAPGDDPIDFTVDYGGAVTAGTFNIYAWKTDGTEPTEIASTNNTAVVSGIAIGY